MTRYVAGSNFLGKKGKVIFKKESLRFLGLITFCVAFGITIGTMGKRGEPMLHFFLILNEIVMKLIKLVMWYVQSLQKISFNSIDFVSRYSPVGIMFLVAGKILEIEDLVKLAQSLGMYALTVLTGLAIHALITLPAIFYAVTRRNPFAFLSRDASSLVDRNWNRFKVRTNDER